MSNRTLGAGGRTSIAKGLQFQAGRFFLPGEKSPSPRKARSEPSAKPAPWRRSFLKHLLGAFGLLCLNGVPAEGTEIPVFIFAGQSIAINSGTDTGLLAPEMLAPQTNVLFYNARTQNPATSVVHWVTYQPPTGPGYVDSGHTNSQGSFGPEITTANLISTRFYDGQPVAVYKYAVGATDLRYWWNPTLPGPLYADMRSLLSNALAALPVETGCTGRLAGVFWTQGESDALDGPDASAAYGSNLLMLVTTLRRELQSPRLPFVYGRILPEWPNSDGVRAGQEALTNQLGDVFMANADDLWTPTRHYDNAGTMTLGDRYGDGFAYILTSRIHMRIGFADGVRLQIQGLPCVNYEVQFAAQPGATEWERLGEGQADTLGVLEFKDEPGPGNRMRFYRFVALQAP